MIYKREAKSAYLFLMPSLIGVSIFVLIPFADVVRRSFCDALGKDWKGMQNYRLVLQNDAFKMAAFNSTRFLGYCVPVLLLVSLIIAVLIMAEKHDAFFKTSFLIPMGLPVASVVLIWKLIFHQNGLLNGLLLQCHLQSIDWMNQKTAFGVLLFSYVWKNTGYDMVLWIAGLHGISESYYEAAKVDGANRMACFWYITLPALRPTIYMITILAIVNSFKVFREAYLVAGEYPNNSIYMLQHLFNNWFATLDVQKMSAAAVLMAVVITVLVIVSQIVQGKEET